MKDIKPIRVSVNEEKDGTTDEVVNKDDKKYIKFMFV